MVAMKSGYKMKQLNMMLIGIMIIQFFALSVYGDENKEINYTKTLSFYLYYLILSCSIKLFFIF